MEKKPFDPSELEVVGVREIPACVKDFSATTGFPMPEKDVIYNRPITAKENFKMLFRGEVPCWMPYRAFLFQDYTFLFSRHMPDTLADHTVLDGGPAVHFPEDSLVTRSWFGIDWVYEPNIGGSIVKPGNPLVKSMANWEDYTSFPNLDEIDWQEMHDMNVKYLDTDRFTCMDLYGGTWERIMSLMDVAEGAVALLDEDQEEGLKRFLAQYGDFMVDLVDRILNACDLDCILLHDDWGHQNSSFFSHDVAEELFFPILKRIVDTCHKHGVYYEQHSCGHNEQFMDLYVKAGVDFYAPQGINDMDAMLEACKSSNMVIAMPDPAVPADASEEEIRRLAGEWFNKYKDYRIAQGFMFTPPAFTDEIYRLSRNYYATKESW